MVVVVAVVAVVVVVVVLTVTLTTMSLAIPTQKMHLIMGSHVPVDMTLGPTPVCRPQKLRLSCPEDTTLPTADCRVAQCVHVSVARQRRPRPDRRTAATAGLHRFLHVDTGHLSSTTTGVSTSLSKQRHGMMCHCRQKACTPT